MIGGIVRASPVCRRELDRPCLLCWGIVCWGIVVSARACLGVAWRCFEQGGGGPASLATRQLFGEFLRQNLRSCGDFHHRQIVVAENSLLDEPFGQLRLHSVDLL